VSIAAASIERGMLIRLPRAYGELWTRVTEVYKAGPYVLLWTADGLGLTASQGRLIESADSMAVAW
jgi:hypothetical protein